MTGETTEPQNTPVDLFGGNSDGGDRLWMWLDVMCLGCRHESVKLRKSVGSGGNRCGIADRAVLDPYSAAMPEWSVDASPKPERLLELGDGPWPACMAYEPRRKRSDAGKRRGPRTGGMEPLFEMGAAS